MKDELRDLIERDTQIQELTRHPGWEVLRDLVLERAEPVQKGLLSGAPKDIERYRYDVGWWQGVRDVLDAPDLHSRRLELVRREHESANPS